MSREEDVKKFQDWAISIGCPIESIPPKNVLIKVFASGQALAMQEMMRRVRPAQDVKRIREQILIRKIENVDPTIVSAKKKLPHEMQRHEKNKLLNDRLENAKKRTEQKKKSQKESAALLRANNIQKIHLKEQIADFTAKKSIYNLKSNEITEKIAEEKEIGKRLDEITPISLDSNNRNESEALAALSTSAIELQSYYTNYSQGDSYESRSSALTQLWKKLREIFAKIPNIVLWSCLSKQMQQKLYTVEAMSKIDLAKLLEARSDQTNGINGTSSRFEIAKLHAKHINLAVQRHVVMRDEGRLMNEYQTSYSSFVTNLCAKFAMYNENDINEDVLEEYIERFALLCYLNGELDILHKMSNENEAEIRRRQKINADYQSANNALRFMYNDIEELYYQVREDICNMAHVKEKIEHIQSEMRYMLQCRNDQQRTILPVNSFSSVSRLNISNGSSFDMSNDSILSTTSDITENARSQVFFTRPTVPIIPQLSNEVKLFADTPVDCFRFKYSMHNELELRKNPIIKLSIFSRFPKDIKALICDYLVTPNTSMKDQKSAVQWLLQLKEMATEVVIGEQLPIVDASQISMQKDKLLDGLLEINDKTTVKCTVARQFLSNLDRHMRFLLENPLPKFIPKSKSFEGRSYQDYEQEFMLYYNIIQNAKSN